MIRKMLFLATLAASLSAQASTLSYYGYTLDTDTHIVTGAGLQWLQWDQTVEVPVKTAEQTYGAAGWRLATAQEMSNLLHDFEFFPCPTCSYHRFNIDENMAQSLAMDFYELPATNVSRFFTLFKDGIVTDGYAPDGDYGFGYFGATFGDDADGDKRYNSVSIEEHHTFTYYQEWLGMVEGYAPARVSVNGDYYPNYENALSGYGLALVREVPLPPTALLFASSSLSTLLLGLRKKVRS